MSVSDVAAKRLLRSRKIFKVNETLGLIEKRVGRAGRRRFRSGE